eukprot:6470870-Amphidinium_carterae.1
MPSGQPVEQAPLADATVTRRDLQSFQQELLATIGAQLQAGFAMLPQMHQQMTAFESRLAEVESKLLRVDHAETRSLLVGMLASAKGESDVKLGVQTPMAAGPPGGLSSVDFSTYYGGGAGKGNAR